MRRSTMSIFGSVKAKRTLERTRLELYQDDDVLYVEMLNGASAFGIPQIRNL